MAFFDILIWIIITLVIGGSVGIGSSKLASLYLKKQDGIRVLNVIKGKSPNNLKLDEETINVKKFQYKRNDGEIIKVNLTDIVKKVSEIPLKQQKTPFRKRLKDKFIRIKNMIKGKKKK